MQISSNGALAWSNETFDLSTSGETEPIDGIYASGRLFEVLGVGPVLGRVLQPSDDVRGGGPDGAVAVISHGLWQRRFGGTPDVIGRQLTIQRVPVTIVGVTPREFLGPEVGRHAQIFVPLAVEALVRGRDSALDRRSSWWLNIMLRLPAGQTHRGGRRRAQSATPCHSRRDDARELSSRGTEWLPRHRFPAGQAAARALDAAPPLCRAADDHHVRGRRRADHRVREHREPDAGARHGTPPRVEPAAGAWRLARPIDPAAPG